MGLEVEVIIPVLREGDPFLGVPPSQPIDLITQLRRARTNFPRGPIKGYFEDGSSRTRGGYTWKQRAAVDVWVPTTIYIADQLKAASLFACPTWANPLSDKGHLDPDVYELKPFHADAAWKMSEDWSIRQPILGPFDEMNACVWVPVEFNSPTMRAVDSNFDQCATMARTVASSTMAHTNSSTGLHVHVGSDTAGFEKKTLALLIAALFVFEPAIETLHPPWRNGWEALNSGPGAGYKYNKDGHSYCWPIRAAIGRRWDPDSWTGENGVEVQPPQWTCPATWSGAAARVRVARTLYRPQYGEADLKACLRGLLNAPSINELMDSLGGGRKVAYNLEQLRQNKHGKFFDGERTRYRTVEFRQHVSTLDDNRIKFWMTFCTKIVEWARRISNDEAARAYVVRNLGVEIEKQCRPDGVSSTLREIFNLIGITDAEIRTKGWDLFVAGQGWNGMEYKKKSYQPTDEKFRALYGCYEPEEGFRYFKIFLREDKEYHFPGESGFRPYAPSGQGLDVDD